MAPMIHCVRHAQGFHNLSTANHSMHDPLLTAAGKEQCLKLQRDFPHHNDIDLIVASPLKRTIYTALYAFGDIIAERKLEIIALPELQETSDLPCDTGSDPEELAQEFKGQPVDLSLVTDGWNSKRMQWGPGERAIEARSRVARQWLLARPKKNIVVVTHGGLLHYFTEDWVGSTLYQGTGWANTEYRSYSFASEDAESPRLEETPESRQRHAGDAKPLDREEQTNLKEAAMKEWEDKGYVQPAEEAARVAMNGHAKA